MSRLTLVAAAFATGAAGAAAGAAAHHQELVAASPYLASFLGASIAAAVGWWLVRRHLPDGDGGPS